MSEHQIDQIMSKSGSALTTRCVTCDKRISRSTGCNHAGMSYSRCGHAQEWLKHIGVTLEPYQSDEFFQPNQAFRVRSAEGKILGHVGRRHHGVFGGDFGYRTRSGRWEKVRYASMGFAAFQMIHGLGYDDMPKRTVAEVTS